MMPCNWGGGEQSIGGEHQRRHSADKWTGHAGSRHRLPLCAWVESTRGDHVGAVGPDVWFASLVAGRAFARGDVGLFALGVDIGHRDHPVRASNELIIPLSA